jgi:(E)-4-hydroxy-3-methylbut-2-enyl-diphosphate synthase
VIKNLLYCNSLTRYSRLVTKEVKIGDIPLGGTNPIRVQSMTTTNTMDTAATVEQSIRMVNAGCEYVRITAPSIKEANNLKNIQTELRKRGYTVPLIADIHFTPNAAEIAARIVEKVRVNPGNYADKKKFEHIDYTDESYHAELDRIRDRFVPLVKICKEHGTAMRIGTNHGSLSDRIMSRYGDTPVGMVESAFEFLKICEDESFYDIVLSMKSSNTRVMVQAYRLLVEKMMTAGMMYPLHLGVTEAGEGEDGRIKSATGIGTLLEDGLGDTIRVSLTEEPEFEIPVARALVARYKNRSEHPSIQEIDNKLTLDYSPTDYNRRKSLNVVNIGSTNHPVVVADLSDIDKIIPSNLQNVGYIFSEKLDKWTITDRACDYIYVGDKYIDFDMPGTLNIICDHATWSANKNLTHHYPLFCGYNFLDATDKSDTLNFISVNSGVIFGADAEMRNKFLSEIKIDSTVVLILETSNLHGMADQRRIFMELAEHNIEVPVIIKRDYHTKNREELQLHASTDIGALFIDGYGDGIWINSSGKIIPEFINQTAFGILQAARVRISKTEYISCPSCGRTLFDLQETTAKIRSRTQHLKGIKIGIMGCIVNGPGEMADADYGYVGSGPGKITLYKGREVMQRGVLAVDAVDALISLIRENGDWVEAN